MLSPAHGCGFFCGLPVLFKIADFSLCRESVTRWRLGRAVSDVLFRGTCRPNEISMREIRIVNDSLWPIPSGILDEIALVLRTDRSGAPSNFVFGLAINPSYG